MVTKRQLRANRQNARLSTGPKTEAGKNNSRMNAYIHGVYDKLLNIRDEDVALFENLRDGLIEQFGPKYPTEYDLIDKLTMSYFRDFQLANSVTIMMEVLPLLEKDRPFVNPMDPAKQKKSEILDRRSKYLSLDDQTKVMKLQSILNAETRKLLKDLRSEIEANDRAEAEFLAEEDPESPQKQKPAPATPGNDNRAAPGSAAPAPGGKTKP